MLTLNKYMLAGKYYLNLLTICYLLSIFFIIIIIFKLIQTDHLQTIDETLSGLYCIIIDRKNLTF